MKNIISAFTITALALVSSCSTTNTSGGDFASNLAKYRSYDRPATLPTNPSAVRVKVSLSNQMAYVMEGSKPLLVMPVAVGKAAKPTPKGNFRIFGKNHYRRANTHGDTYLGSKSAPTAMHKTYLKDVKSGWKFSGTPMPYWCEFKSSYGFHTGWLKPYPCSSGCLRMHENVAPKFFRLVSNGTSVNIAQSQPEDATIGKNIPRPISADVFPSEWQLQPGNKLYLPSTRLSNEVFTNHKTPTFN